MNQLKHGGLFFTDQQIAQAKKDSKRQPIAAAFAALHNAQRVLDAAKFPALLAAIYYRFGDNADTGNQAVSLLTKTALSTTLTTPDALREAVAWLQTYELLRAHPAFAEVIQAQNQAAIRHFATAAQSIGVEAALPVQVWAALGVMAAGVALEDAALIDHAATVYQTVITQHIHPEGYLPQIVEDAAPDAPLLEQSLLTAQGLVLLAEAGQHAGPDLWRYHHRGVSVVTAALYPLYYYFYPEKWQWSVPIEAEATLALFRRYVSYLEPLNAHLARPTKAIDLIFDDLRPVFDVWGGGMLTLTHGVVRRGLFG